ncbi:MAG: aminoglycoside phosphotransferase family protein, partial [Arthrobacter sp.]|nr:aminoglycoside phosphotransferase family protein [Arthrobacter sp.]
DVGRGRVWVHGDFSADQVLVEGAAVRLVDFDRMGRGEPEADLGAFAAVEEINGAPPAGGAAGGVKTQGLLAGYRQAGGRVDPARMRAWAAVRLFTGSVDPFRDRAPDWAAETCRHLQRAGELIP